MKKATWIIALLLFTVAANAQLKKEEKPKPKTENKTGVAKPALADSISLNAKVITDTIPARLLCYVEDGTLLWKKGFVLNNIVVFATGARAQDRQIAVDEKFNAVRPEDLYDVRTVPKK